MGLLTLVVLGLVALCAVVGWRSKTRTGDYLRGQMVGALIFTAFLGLLPMLLQPFGRQDDGFARRGGIHAISVEAATPRLDDMRIPVGRPAKGDAFNLTNVIAMRKHDCPRRRSNARASPSPPVIVHPVQARRNRYTNDMILVLIRGA